MLSKHWKFQAAILTILGVLFAITLPLLTNIKALSQTPSVPLPIAQCTDVEIQQHIEQLGNGEPSAFEGLVSCKSKAVPALIKALKNQDKDARLIIISVLGQIGSQAAPAIPSLTEFLKDESSDVRIITVQTLGKIGKDAVPALITALKREDGYASPVPSSDAIDVLGEIGKDAVPALIAALKDEDWGIGNGAVSALGKIGKDAVPALFTALKDENSITRSRAASALAEIGVEVIPDLIQALEDNDSKVRSGAADALGDIGFEAKAAVPALMTAFQDTDSKVRSSAAYALVQIGIEPKFAVSVLRTVIHDQVAPKKSAFPVIVRVSPQNLREFTNNNTRETPERAWTKGIVRSWAILALADTGVEAIPDLIQALNDREPFAFFHSEERALRKIGKDAVPALIADLQSQESRTRSRAAYALMQIGKDAQSAVPALITALQDENSDVRFSAAIAIFKIGGNPKDVIPELIPAIKYEHIGGYLCGPNSVLAHEALVEIGKDVVPVLIAALNDKYVGFKYGAVVALGEIGADAKDAVPELTKIFLDRNEDIWMRDEAIKSLKKINSSEAISIVERYRKTTDEISHWVAQHPNLGICVQDPAPPVREATTAYVSARPPAICRIRAIRAVLRWKCP
ncbi:HEAT repeat domain-containing protein [Allocoleopsis franciscana]|uniref:HEAT-like repeat protein n=1 Tax=Allocoleopsis franciscana PCC 7113 TaxID=1173027 RepID=K9WQN6_9CYAN|nr:HEAT repeat domain-containing protein [Allocoleopsis franciscana]AFZ22074.1 HEAT-like repeat protein [Allocoleopsis franciscana PCC 7113]